MSTSNDLQHSGRSILAVSRTGRLHLVLAAVRAGLAEMASAFRARRVARQLHQLSDRELKDIGFPRSEIDYRAGRRRILPLRPAFRGREGHRT